MSDADPTIDRVETIDPETARVLGNEIRAKLLDLLAVESRTIEQLQDLLEERGETLAETSVRHHVGILVDAGMVVIARREDVNGGVRKHYRATTHVYAYDTTGADDAFTNMQGMVRAEMLSLCSRLGATHREDLQAVADELAADECYENGDPVAFIFRELLERTLTELEGSGTLQERLPPLEQ